MDNKSVTIVTGGGRGIGRAIALRMAKETAVLIVGRTPKDLLSVRDEIIAGGGTASYIVGDVADPHTARRTVEYVVRDSSTVRNLVCNAGISKGGASESFDTGLWKEIHDVNVNGSFHFVKACLPFMLQEKRGAICLISSTAGLKGYSHNSAYVSSKHALVGMAKSLAVEHGKNGIISVAICPGFVESEMTTRSIASLMARRGCTETEARKRIAKVNPQQRIILPEEVAEMVAFVCSGKVPSLSGNPIILSGGE